MGPRGRTNTSLDITTSFVLRLKRDKYVSHVCSETAASVYTYVVDVLVLSGAITSILKEPPPSSSISRVNVSSQDSVAILLSLALCVLIRKSEFLYTAQNEN